MPNWVEYDIYPIYKYNQIREYQWNYWDDPTIKRRIEELIEFWKDGENILSIIKSVKPHDNEMQPIDLGASRFRKFEVQIDEDGFPVLHFKTDWTPAIEFLDRLAWKFWELDFTVRYFESREQLSGEICYVRGIKIKEERFKYVGDRG